MMRLIKPGFRFNLIGQSRVVFVICALCVLASWILVFTKGINFGIDFRGGTEVLIGFKAPVELTELRGHVANLGLEQPEVVGYGMADSGRYLIRSRTHSVLTDNEKVTIKSAVVAQLGEPVLWDDSDESGEEIRVRFNNEVPADTYKKILASVGFSSTTITPQTDSANPVMILNLGGVRARVNETMSKAYGDKFVGIERLESVGSAVGEQMRTQGTMAVLYSLIALLLYISFRFDLRYSPGAVIALFHDVSLALGVFSILNLEFNLAIVAAFLTIVGYSLNDTIVIYDRVRERLREGMSGDLQEAINTAASETLSRTIITSVTTFLAVLALLLFGGGSLTAFSVAMMCGVICGTISTLYVACPCVLFMDKLLKKRAASQPVQKAA